MLLEQAGEIVSREAMSQQLWPGETFVEFDQSLGAAVMKLRHALRDDADNPRFVETIPRRGFRFIAPVTQPLADTNDSAAVPEELKAQSQGAAASGQRALPHGWLALTGGLFVVIVLVVVWSRALVPLPPPKVLATSQLTHDGIFKDGLLTDGSRLYFVEDRGGTNNLLQTSVTGGEAIPIAMPFQFFRLHDISPNGSQLLAITLTPTEREGDAWTVRLPAAAPTRLANVTAHGGAWSRDGRELVFANGSDLFLARADGTGEHKLINVPGAPFDPRFSPDGSRIRFAINTSDNTSAMWEVRADGTKLGAIFPSLRSKSSQCCGVWTADGRYYLFVASTGAVGNIWARREAVSFLQGDDSPPVQLTTGPLAFGALAPSPAGDKVFAEASQSRGELVRYDSRSNQFVPFLSGMSAGELNFSRDAQWVAYISYPEGTLWRSRADGSDRLQLTRAPLFAVLPRWSPDGTQIAFAGAELGKPWKILLVPASGGTPREVCTENRTETDPTWSPDGKQLLFGRASTAGGVAFSRVAKAGGTEKIEINVVDLASHQVSVVPGSDTFFSPRWSPDGKYIAAFTGDSKKLVLFDFKTRKWTAWVASQTGSIASLNWSRDLHYVYYDMHSAQESAFQRIKMGDAHAETIVESTHLHRYIEPHVGPWSGLAPDGSALFVRDLSTDEVYVLDLQLP